WMAELTPTTDGSTYSPVSRSTIRGVMRLNFCSISSAATWPLMRLAARRIFSFTFSSLLRSWVGFSRTAALATMMEQTKQSARATTTVPKTLSLRKLDTSQPPLDIRLHDQMVNVRSEQVGKQDCEHHALRVCGVNHPNQHDHQTNQDTENPFAGVRHR